MTDNEPDTKDGIDLPSNAAVYGVDDVGATHYHSAVRGAVWVVQDDEIVQHYTDVQIDDWHAYVADRRGWAQTHYSSQSTADWLLEELEQLGVTA